VRAAWAPRDERPSYYTPGNSSSASPGRTPGPSSAPSPHDQPDRHGHDTPQEPGSDTSGRPGPTLAPEPSATCCHTSDSGDAAAQRPNSAVSCASQPSAAPFSDPISPAWASCPEPSGPGRDRQSSGVSSERFCKKRTGRVVEESLLRAGVPCAVRDSFTTGVPCGVRDPVEVVSLIGFTGSVVVRRRARQRLGLAPLLAHRLVVLRGLGVVGLSIGGRGRASSACGRMTSRRGVDECVSSLGLEDGFVSAADPMALGVLLACAPAREHGVARAANPLVTSVTSCVASAARCCSDASLDGLGGGTHRPALG
jgi:hypothetical protein